MLRRTLLKITFASININPLLLLKNTIVGEFIIHKLLHFEQEQDVTNTSLDLLKNNLNPSSVHMVHFLGRELKNNMGDDIYYSNLKSTSSSYESIISSLSIIAQNYENQKANNDLGLTLLKGNNELVKGAIGAGILLAPETGAGSLVLAGVAYAADKGLGQVEAIVAETSKSEIRKNLKTALDSYRAITSLQDYQALLQNGDVKSFKHELERRTSPILGDALSSISPEDQYLVTSFYDKEIASIMSDGFTALANVQSLQGDEIKTNQKNILGLARVFAQYATHSQVQLNGILKSQKDIQSSLNDLNLIVGDTEKGVSFIREYLFGKMTPAEQLVALQNDAFPNMPDDQKDQLNKKIELVKSRQDLNDSIIQYLNAGNEIVNIAKNLNISSDIIGKAQMAISGGTQIFNACNAFASGNALSGLSSLSNLFGFGGKDIAQERHEQIMDVLGKLYSRIDLMDQKLDQLRQGQLEILKNQKVIFDAVLALSRQMQDNFDNISEQLKELRSDVLYNRKLTNSLFAQQYSNCYDLIYDPITGARVIDTSKYLYPLQTEMKQLFLNMGNYLKGCEDRMQNIRGDLHNTFHPVFFCKTYDTPETNIDLYLTRVYKPSLDVLRDSSVLRQKPLDQKFCSLFCPLNSVDLLDKKTSVALNIDRPPRFKISYDSLMSDMLSPSIVIYHCNSIIDIHYFFQFIKQSGEQYSLDELLHQGTIRRTGYYYLNEALSLIDIAIAQSTLLSGDVLLPMLYEIFTNQFTSPSQQQQALFLNFKLITDNNSIVANNFIMYAIRKEVLLRSNFINYSIAFDRSDIDFIKTITISNWDFQWSDIEIKDSNKIKQCQGWSVKIDDKFYPLPKPIDLLDGKLIYQTDLYRLIPLRSRIAEEIAGYDLINGISNERRLAYNEILLNSL